MSRPEFDIFVEQTLRNGPEGKPNLPAGATSPQAQMVLIAVLLSRHAIPAPPADLADRVLKKIRQEAAAEPELEEEHRRPLPWLWRSEWWAAAASIAAFFGILIPLVQQSRNVASRQACQFNLAAVGQGLNAYQTAFSGDLPYVSAPAGATWAWTPKNQEQVYPNTRNPFLLVKQGFVSPPSLICPTSLHHQILTLASANLHSMDNFQNPDQFSYSFHDMLAGQPHDSRPGEFALLADRNPVFEERRCGGCFESQPVNSLNHGAAGQNVLYHDNHVEWHGSPTVGVRQDNIWTSASKPAGTYEGTETPAGPDDSFLVP